MSTSIQLSYPVGNEFFAMGSAIAMRIDRSMRESHPEVLDRLFVGIPDFMDDVHLNLWLALTQEVPRVSGQ